LLNASAPTSYTPDEFGIDVKCSDPRHEPWQAFELAAQRRGGTYNDDDLSSTHGERLVFKEQYIELRTALDARATLFSGGERTGNGLALARDGASHALWNRDCASSVTHQNLYSSWPLLIAVTADGRAHGYLMLSSNAEDIVPAKSALSWRLTGGIVDLFVFAGPTPLDVFYTHTRPSSGGRPSRRAGRSGGGSRGGATRPSPCSRRSSRGTTRRRFRWRLY
jgi:hypothetical protein